MEILTEYISNIGNQFIDPKKRVFVAYIGISILIAFLWFVLLRRYSFFAAFKKVFDKKASSQSPFVILKNLNLN